MVDDPSARELAALLREIAALGDSVAREGEELAASFGAEAGDGRAHNLGAYLALRRRDITRLQDRLAAFGLSSFGRSEGKVRLQLDALAATLRRLNGEPDAPYPGPDAFAAAAAELQAQTKRLFGPRRPGAPRARIMATLPPETSDAAFAHGAECVMLNKGPHLAEGVAFLRDVLARMDRHHSKRFERYARLQTWG